MIGKRIIKTRQNTDSLIEISAVQNTSTRAIIDNLYRSSEGAQKRLVTEVNRFDLLGLVLGYLLFPGDLIRAFPDRETRDKFSDLLMDLIDYCDSKTTKEAP